jgi:hypothetical protein
MPGRNCEFDSSVADKTATAGYQDGMSLVGHIGNILLRLPQQGSFAPLVYQSKEKRVTSAAGTAKMPSERSGGRLALFRGAD